MKSKKYLAILAVMIFGVAGLAVAQEGYYGQQASKVPAVQSQPAAPIIACACGHNHVGVATGMPSVIPAPAPADRNDVRTQKQDNKSSGASTEGDPSAPQNQVEFGGGS